MKQPTISICVPIHDMENGDFFLSRLINSLFKQTYRDFEIVISKTGKGMAANTNEAIKRAKGKYIKILFMDDYLIDQFSLYTMFDSFNGKWLIAGADNNPNPYWTNDIETGNNRLGSPSALMFKNDKPLLFDEKMSWLLDCDLYKRLFNRYGEPSIVSGKLIGIGIHKGQMTNILTNEEKTKEYVYMMKKYAKTP